MERAGSGLADAATAMAPGGRIVVVAGKGNNAGDGFVAARLLRAGGREVDVLMTAAREDFGGDAAANLERLPGDAPLPLEHGIAADAALVIDALLGTGATGAPRGRILEAIEAIRACRAPVLAADVPSGVDASTGETEGLAVLAAATATFHAAKPGLWITPGRDCAGEVSVIDIGIPDGAPVEADAGLIREAVLGEIPRRGGHSTKFSSGRVLVAGGSSGLTGAPCLAALAAARAGAGYVTVCVPASLSLVFESRLLETMTIALPDAHGAHVEAGVEGLREAVSARGGALVLGPGLGRSDGAARFARGALEAVEVPVVLDADGLNAYAGDLAALHGRAAVLTPHEGELGAAARPRRWPGDRGGSPAQRARGGGARRRRDRAQGRRHARRLTRWLCRRERRGDAGAGDRRHRRRPLGRDRGDARKGARPVHGGVRRGAPARPRRHPRGGQARRRRGRDRLRRDRGACRGALM